jgi:hypothetical protein
MNDAERIQLLRKVYKAVGPGVESFERDDMIGHDLARLVGAILNDTYCEWPEGRAILGILHKRFPFHHPVFRFARFENE